VILHPKCCVAVAVESIPAMAWLLHELCWRAVCTEASPITEHTDFDSMLERSIMFISFYLQ